MYPFQAISLSLLHSVKYNSTLTSTGFAVLLRGRGGGVSHPVLAGRGVSILFWPGGGYPFYSGWGVSQDRVTLAWDWNTLSCAGVPPEGTWDQSLGYPPGKDMGPVKALWVGDGVTPPPLR